MSAFPPSRFVSLLVVLAAGCALLPASASAAGAGPRDLDGDGISNGRDRDVDGDGRANGRDRDVDGDGRANGRDRDVDGDRLANRRDRDVDGDRKRNGRDRDVDGDGRSNRRDRDVDGDGVSNGRDRDTDGDGVRNRSDLDVDGDGLSNGRDRDTDGDGRANSRDRDVDGDGVGNTTDEDIDGDGSKNLVDDDIDGDGARNEVDDDSDSSGTGIGDAVPAGPVPDGFFGLTAESVFFAHGADRRRMVAEIAATGASAIRQNFAWSAIETSPGRYDFRAYDLLVLEAARKGIEILPSLVAPPAFRSSAPASGRKRGVYPPKDNGAFGSFSAVLVRRYGPKGTLWGLHPEVRKTPIRAWQVWNEPNVAFYWPDGPDAGEYVAMLRTVGAAIRRADPTAEIVTAGLPKTRTGTPIEEFLPAMYRAGARGTFDTLAVHPYASAADGVMDLLTEARQILDGNGDRDANLRATEIGWGTDGPDDQPFIVGESAQAELIERVANAFAAQRDRLRLRSMFYFNWQDTRPGSDGRDLWYLHAGLKTLDGRRKPGYQAFSEIVRRLNGR